jgi:hypothetical protein
MGLCIFVGTLLLAAPVAAQDEADEVEVPPETQTESSERLAEAETIDEPYAAPAALAAPERNERLLGVGLGFSAGGGYVGFLDDEFNDFVDPGGGWGARVLVGTETWLGFEASYMGTVNDMDVLGLTDDAYLLGNGAAAALRLNLLPPSYDFRPYLSAGAAWMHYSVENADNGTSPLRDSGDVFSVPLAGGFFYDYDRLFVDLRVQLAPAVDDDLVREDFSDDTNMSTWRAVGNIGFEL